MHDKSILSRVYRRPESRCFSPRREHSVRRIPRSETSFSGRSEILGIRTIFVIIVHCKKGGKSLVRPLIKCCGKGIGPRREGFCPRRPCPKCARTLRAPLL